MSERVQNGRRTIHIPTSSCCWPWDLQAWRRKSIEIVGKLLMKLGLGLIVVGHLNFIVGAIVHGLVLRHVAKLQDTISLQYSVSNVLTVTSAILSISCGLVAIFLSRYLHRTPLRWTVLVLAVINALITLLCMVGLAASVIITLSNNGRTLLAPCPFSGPDYMPSSLQCPFDPTRIYSTTLCLWVIAIILDITELVFSIRCFLLILYLLQIKLCPRKRSRKEVTLQLPEEEEEEEERLFRASEHVKGAAAESVWL
ncbi:transmembrane protein 54-like [Rhinatrema bivittatum]|uniref:transmembrane protein 54-like n=1 Tax=Rhinatrema bivittatum TaxID=194408 RepID=UPI00112BCE47|nr:transmembrane protein 54-like [Rhinatrema bivittatum]